MIYTALRAFRFFRDVKVGDKIELNESEAKRFEGIVEPEGVQSSSIETAPNKKYKKGRTKNV